jgi:hypothetical protein
MYVREQKFSIEKHKIFLFKVFDFWFFHKNFHPTTVSDPNPNPYPNPNFLFGFGSSQNIRIISDSDPQHWFAHTNNCSGEQFLLRTIIITGRWLQMCFYDLYHTEHTDSAAHNHCPGSKVSSRDWLQGCGAKCSSALLIGQPKGERPDHTNRQSRDTAANSHCPGEQSISSEEWLPGVGAKYFFSDLLIGKP